MPNVFIEEISSLQFNVIELIHVSWSDFGGDYYLKQWNPCGYRISTATQLVFSSSGFKIVSSHAALRTDGALSLILVNRNAKAAQVNIDIWNFEITGTAKWVVLDENHLADEMPVMQVNNQTSIELPAVFVTF